MWEIDKVLSEAKKPMTLTEIIMKIKGLTPYREYSDICKRKIRKCGLELASAIIQQDCYEMQWTVTNPDILLARVCDPTNPKIEEAYQNSKAERRKILDVIKEADKLYALYSRSIKLLYQNKWVEAGGYRYNTLFYSKGEIWERTRAEAMRKKSKAEEYRNCRTYQLTPHLNKRNMQLYSIQHQLAKA
jgi:hypothetical protein